MDYKKLIQENKARLLAIRGQILEIKSTLRELLAEGQRMEGRILQLQDLQTLQDAEQGKGNKIKEPGGQN